MTDPTSANLLTSVHLNGSAKNTYHKEVKFPQFPPKSPLYIPYQLHYSHYLIKIIASLLLYKIIIVFSNVMEVTGIHFRILIKWLNIPGIWTEKTDKANNTFIN